MHRRLLLDSHRFHESLCVCRNCRGAALAQAKWLELFDALSRNHSRYVTVSVIISSIHANLFAEGSWDDVTKIIGQAHSLLHGSGVIRIQSDIRIGTRTDKKQTFEDKVAAVQAILAGEEITQLADSDDGMNDDDSTQHMQDLGRTLQQNMNSNIHPGLDRMVPPSPYVQAPAPQMVHPMGHPGMGSAIPPHMAQHMAQGMLF